jgi:hypothetical protein
MTTAICIASGTSLTQEDVDYCRGKGRVYAVKEAHILAPWADVLYCADEDWWALKQGVPGFAGEKWTVSPDAARQYRLNYVEGSADIEWGHTPELIAYGGNSGFQALNLAVVQGASKVVLLGYDYGLRAGKKHWFDGTKHERTSRPSHYHEWLPRIHAAAKHIKIPVINCSLESAIECFPKMTVREALA